MEEIRPDRELIHAYFFFVDIKGLSNPDMSVKSQKKKIPLLIDFISKTDVYQKTPKQDMLILPTGDGMCIAFLQGTDKPLLLAIQVHQKIREYNSGKFLSEHIQVRIGLNGGSCFVVKNITGGEIPWGPGIILAQRAMDLGEDGHIFLSKGLADELIALSDEYRKIIHTVGECHIKHGKMVICSAYGEGFGNPIPPEDKLVKDSELNLKIQKESFLYPSIAVELSIIDTKTLLVRHKRTYEIETIQEEEFDTVKHGIGLDVKKKGLEEELKIKVVDENQNKMQIWYDPKKITDTSKEFYTIFNTPIKKGDKGRKYTLTYEVEEPNRYFENFFQVDVPKFFLDLKYPSSFECSPTIFEVNYEEEENHPKYKVKTKIQPKIEQTEKGFVAKYYSENNKKGSTIRLEW